LQNYHYPQYFGENGLPVGNDGRLSPNSSRVNETVWEIPLDKRVILAGEHTSWPRLDAKNLKDRTYEHGAKVIRGKPITLGHGYSTIGWIPEQEGSWALPPCHVRITSYENALTKGAFQLKQVCKHLGVRPISLWDSEYGCAPFLKLTKDIAADKVMRLRPNRCIWAAPPPIINKGKGRLRDRVRVKEK
jgi:hypothetical protein